MELIDVQDVFMYLQNKGCQHPSMWRKNRIKEELTLPILHLIDSWYTESRLVVP